MKKIKITLCLCCLYSATSFSWTKENHLDGLGVEILTGGVGQARLGSSGAVASNPALLAWISKKQQFFSTNQINFYGLKTGDGASIDVSPDVTPLYAVTTEGFDKWGHGYGLITSNMKLAYSFTEEDRIGSGVQETQELGLNYAFGYLLSDNFAVGIGIYASRLQEGRNSSVLSEEAGNKFVISVDVKNSIWVQGLSLGMAGKYKNWDFGLSTKFSTITYMAQSDSTVTGYMEQGNVAYRTKDDSIPPIDLLSNVSGGVRTRLKTIAVLFDVNWIPGIQSSEMEEYLGTQLLFSLGLEGEINERYKWYGGLKHETPGQGAQSTNTLSLGASKKNKHSLNFAGFSWLKENKHSGSQVVMVNFGTMFDY